MQIRNCTTSDVDKIRQFVNSCKPLTLHTAYTYWVMFNYLSEGCFVMEEDEKAVGYASGVKSSTEEDVFFMWQIGIAEEFRGKGLSQVLIEKIVNVAKKQNCNILQLTIEPDNEASFSTFNNYAKKNNLIMETAGEAKYNDSLSGKTESETLYEIKLR